MALARMLVIVSTIFILTSLPIVILGITQSIVDDFFINHRYNNIFLLCHAIHMELGMINCSGINFFVYVLRSSRFRQELARLSCFGFLKLKKTELKKAGVTTKKLKKTELKEEGVTMKTAKTGVSALCGSETL